MENIYERFSTNNIYIYEKMFKKGSVCGILAKNLSALP